ncbi:hypothetical protein SDC9_129333 [bioreactor metagenome]|uniref:Uncharacterized protein n=1 Tax=bioreactor metagenome TaxID=1076179 RepID=A0A645D0E0_9ZZZZ
MFGIPFDLPVVDDFGELKKDCCFVFADGAQIIRAIAFGMDDLSRFIKFNCNFVRFSSSHQENIGVSFVDIFLIHMAAHIVIIASTQDSIIDVFLEIVDIHCSHPFLKRKVLIGCSRFLEVQ